MLSVLSTIRLRSAWLIMLCTTSLFSFAQINSPYSRYGMGDIYPSGNAVNKAMGSLSTAYADYQSVNFLNPASYSRIGLTTFDVSTEIESRMMRSSNKADKYNSANFTFNYLTLGVPLNKKGTWGMAFGLRPVSKISYKVESRERLNVQQALKDSILSLYEGNGGSYKAFWGMGRKFGSFSIGANIGYHFGQKEISTRRIFINDTVPYYKSNSADNVSFGSFFTEVGFQYDAIIGKNNFIRIGATYALQQQLKAKKDVIRETFDYVPTTSGATYQIDSVYKATDIAGNIQYPHSYSAGFVFGKRDSLTKMEKWMIGIQYDAQFWDNYSFYGQKDQLANNYIVRIGGQITPNMLSNNLFNRLTYRAGFYFGNDYLNINNKQLPVFAATFGVGIPVKRQSFYTNQFTAINIGFEAGRRGDASSSIKENIFKLHIGLSLSDIWFQKRKYD